jgi:hypothetical protein
MGIISNSLARVITNPTLDLSSFAFAADRLAFAHDSANFDLAEYRPGWQSDDYQPDPVEEAEWTGFELGLEGANADHPDGTGSTPEWVAFLRGWVAGTRARVDAERAERAEFQAWLDSVEADRPEPDYYELIRGRSLGGHPASE